MVRETCWLWLSTVSNIKQSWPQPLWGCFTKEDHVTALGRTQCTFWNQNCILVYLALSISNALIANVPCRLVTNIYSETSAFRMICVLDHFSCGCAFFFPVLFCPVWLHFLCLPPSSVDNVFPFNFMRQTKGILIPSPRPGEEKPTSGGHSQLQNLLWHSLLWNPTRVTFCLNTLQKGAL